MKPLSQGSDTKVGNPGKSAGCLWRDRADAIELVMAGATLYLCGDGQHMAPAVHETCVIIYQEATVATHDEAEKWMGGMERVHARYVADVFA